MQGQFRKNFRLRGRGCGTGSGARGPRRPIRPAGRAPRAAAWPPPSLPAPGRPPPGTSRHGCGPSTTFGRHPPTMASRVKIKPQVDGLRFSRNTGYGRGAGAKRSRWAASVAAASRAAGPDAWRWTNKLICGQVMLSSSRNRPVFIHLTVVDSCG